MTDQRKFHAIILHFVQKHTKERDAPMKFESVAAYRFGAHL